MKTLIKSCVLALCLGLLPTTLLANSASLYYGNTYYGGGGYTYYVPTAYYNKVAPVRCYVQRACLPVHSGSKYCKVRTVSRVCDWM